MYIRVVNKLKEYAPKLSLADWLWVEAVADKISVVFAHPYGFYLYFVGDPPLPPPGSAHVTDHANRWFTRSGEDGPLTSIGFKFIGYEHY